jgi:CubicO group peptidase (beta-lactamase class C family)
MRKAFKRLGVIAVLLAIPVGMLAVVYRAEIIRLWTVINLFEPNLIVENFRTMDRLFEYREVRRGDEVWQLPAGTPITLPDTFAFGEKKRINTAEFLTYTNTTGLIVLHDGAVVFEEYYMGEARETRHISWSVAKSFTSALVGIALDEGHIKDVMDPVTRYAPVLSSSGYDKVPLKHVLQMSSGVRFNEDYADFFADINRMGRTLAMRSPIAEFVCSLESERPSGTVNHYVSMDTQVLCMVLREATGKTLTQLTEEKLWHPIGMESDAYWLTDATGMELAFGCLNAVLRDYARFGLVYMNGGKRGDKQIVPAAWVRASTTPDGPHVMPREDVTSVGASGYGYQWWVPAGNRGDFIAVGVYNQFIYVNPARRVVIAKTSANPHYLKDDSISEPQTTELFRAIAAQFP